METKNIFQRINAVMQDQSIYIKKGSAGQGTGVSYDEVIAVLAPLLTKHGIVISIDKVGDSGSRETKKGAYIYECDYKISYINIDNPADRLESIVEAHAQDGGDKAPGKTATYATKVSMLKVFSIESGDNEESRSEVRDTSMIDEHTVAFLEQQMVEVIDGTSQWTKQGQRLLQKYRLGSVAQLKESKLAAFKRDLGA
tara:strand:- start:941 stop:1534 length:594 start_codon:yes stop_codon:yes gene_type:complete